MVVDVVIKLVPFLVSIFAYFKVFGAQTEATYFAALLKCLPILFLIVFTVWHGNSKGYKGRHSSYQKFITLGLCCSCIGDYCLIWPKLFVFGMVAFSLAHLNYLKAFGFRPFNVKICLVTYLAALIGCIYLKPGLEGLMLPAVPFYTFLLSTMMWRAISRIQKESWTWLQALTAVGSIMFVFSDLLIAAMRFRDLSIPYPQLVIMGTYYFAQFGIALSIIDGPNYLADDYHLNKRV